MFKYLRTTILTMLLAVFAIAASAQGDMPVHFKVTKKQVSPTELDVIFTAKIANGWHVYSTGLPADGPVSATLTTEKSEGAKAAGRLTPRRFATLSIAYRLFRSIRLQARPTV